MEVESKNQELKHLRFMRIAAMHALVCVSSLYDYAKQNSGPLRSTVGTVEGAVTTVVGPVYEKFKGVPGDLLVFFDKKVDEASNKFDEHAPPLAKQVVSQAQCMIQKASQKAQALVREAQVGGPRAAVHYAAKEYKQFLLDQVVRMWYALDQIPPFHKVAEMAVPTAAHWCEKYNYTVRDTTLKGCTVFGYLPLVPIDSIAKTFKQGKTGKEEDVVFKQGKTGKEEDVVACVSHDSDTD
ncbi:hypothetical protein L1049_005835 [Liquidambar formosana]|uniref:REF/SRPP-like protein n=1 Tax=Liquidambar formosana TaxID=63359 RepID=A0AAP0REC4_LIQFO